MLLPSRAVDSLGFGRRPAYFVNQEFAFGGLVDLDRLILVAPEGTIHLFLGVPFWKAMFSCCGFEPIFGPMADDSGFLARLVDDLLVTFPIDSARVYFLGASNGGAMAYRFALDLDESVPGAETERQRYRGCRGNIFVELWTLHVGPVEGSWPIGWPANTRISSPDSQASRPGRRTEV